MGSLFKAAMSPFAVHLFRWQPQLHSHGVIIAVSLNMVPFHRAAEIAPRVLSVTCAGALARSSWFFYSTISMIASSCSQTGT